MVFTTPHVDSGDTYATDGTFLFHVTFHETEHFTITKGLTRIDFSKGHFHFFGDC
jgi:hypothetical protein